MPLPPYIAGKRPPTTRDRADYQTVYASEEGAVAAPTAGPAFHRRAARAARRRAASRRHFVTLHVGAGTFLPVKADDTADHRMHAEWGEVDADDGRARSTQRGRAGGRIVARRHHLAAAAGERRAARTARSQPFARRDRDLHHAGLPLPRGRRADDQFPPAALDPVHAGLAPSPGSRRMQAAYAHAIAAGYRFYSYGDASLLFRAPGSPDDVTATDLRASRVDATDGAARAGGASRCRAA